MKPRLKLYHKTLIAQHIVIMLAVVFLCVGTGFIGFQIYKTVQSANQTIKSINTTINSINTTVSAINRPETGTLAIFNTDLNTAKSVLIHSDMILNHEQKQLTTLDAQEKTFFNDLHNLSLGLTNELGQLQTTTVTLNDSLKYTNQSLQKLPPLVNQLTVTTASLNAKINDPHITQLLTALAETTVQVQGTATDVRKVSDHFEQKIDAPKKKGLWNKIWGPIKDDLEVTSYIFTIIH